MSTEFPIGHTLQLSDGVAVRLELLDLRTTKVSGLLAILACLERTLGKLSLRHHFCLSVGRYREPTAVAAQCAERLVLGAVRLRNVRTSFIVQRRCAKRLVDV